MPSITAFLNDYSSYILMCTSMLTCYEFFKSNSKIFVVVAIFAAICLTVIFHNSILNYVSIAAEVLSVYRHSRHLETGRINFRKLTVILIVPLAILLISHVGFSAWQNVRTNEILTTKSFPEGWLFVYMAVGLLISIMFTVTYQVAPILRDYLDIINIVYPILVGFVAVILLTLIGNSSDFDMPAVMLFWVLLGLIPLLPFTKGLLSSILKK